jgi:poly(A) polymerase
VPSAERTSPPAEVSSTFLAPRPRWGRLAPPLLLARPRWGGAGLGAGAAGEGEPDTQVSVAIFALALPLVVVSDLRAAASHLIRAELGRHDQAIDALAGRFSSAGHRLALVGGPVRDALLGRLGNDLDFTTDAPPEVTKRLLSGWAEAVWETGIAFGTIGAKHVDAAGEVIVEITTYRSESYDRTSRKPEVEYGTSIEGDLRRRDFTVNAMALELTTQPAEFIDLFDGVKDLQLKVLRTPGTAEESFDDDPLRMLRAARFASQLGFSIAPEIVEAMGAMRQRLEIVSAERVRDEFIKLLMSPDPRVGLTLLVDTGLAEIVLPELPKLRLEIDEHHRHKDVYEHSLIVLEQAIELEDRIGGPDLVMRLAALLHDIGKPKTRALIPGGGVSFHHHEVVGAKLAKSRLKALRFDNDTIEAVTSLIALHLRFHGYGTGEWTDSAVRRYVRDAGSQLERLHILTRSDCTTRNQRKAATLAATYDALEERIARLAEEEELASMRPDLDGNQIMTILGIGPSRAVGEAYNYLLEARIDDGPLGEEKATQLLREWWSARAE